MSVPSLTTQLYPVHLFLQIFPSSPDILIMQILLFILSQISWPIVLYLNYFFSLFQFRTLLLTYHEIL